MKEEDKHKDGTKLKWQHLDEEGVFSSGNPHISPHLKWRLDVDGTCARTEIVYFKGMESKGEENEKA